VWLSVDLLPGTASQGPSPHLMVVVAGSPRPKTMGVEITHECSSRVRAGERLGSGRARHPPPRWDRRWCSSRSRRRTGVRPRARRWIVGGLIGLIAIIAASFNGVSLINVGRRNINWMIMSAGVAAAVGFLCP
jgi:hypothetical protein